MKKTAFVALGLSFALLSPAYAADKISVTVDSKPLTFDVEPFMQDDRVLVPLRAIFEALGCDVSYIEETETVFAKNGTKFVSLDIGSDEMFLKDKTVKLDVAAQIKNDRTFVPVRAISESFNAAVDWDDATNTVIIETKKTQHKITREKISEEFKDDSGNVILKTLYEYPSIENPENDEYIAELNEYFKNNITEFSADADEWTAAAKEHCDLTDGENWEPYEVSFTYDIDTDKNNLLGVTYQTFANFRGAHPITAEFSEIFDLSAKKQLEFSDILAGTAEEAEEFVKSVFAEEIQKEPDMYFEDALETLKSDECVPEMRLTDTAVEIYLNPYEIAPYASGIITIEIPFEENENIFNPEFLNPSEVK